MRVLAGVGIIFRPCDYGRRDLGRPGQGRGSCQLAEAEKCNIDSQLSGIGWLLQVFCPELFLDSHPTYAADEGRCQFSVVKGVREQFPRPEEPVDFSTNFDHFSRHYRLHSVHRRLRFGFGCSPDAGR